MTDKDVEITTNDLHNGVHEHLNGNVERIYLKDLMKKSTYTKMNICVDGREDGEGIASFGWFAGTIGAMLPALKDICGDALTCEEIYGLIETYMGEEKCYSHCDDHTQEHTDGASCSDCETIGCGAIKYMLTPALGEEYGYTDTDRSFLWKFIDTHSETKVLQWSHLEKGIISIENTIRVDKDTGEQYLNYTTGNTSKETGNQYFIYHVTGKNLIIQYATADMAQTMIDTLDALTLEKIRMNIAPDQETWDMQSILHTALQEKTTQWSDRHAGNTLDHLAPAANLIAEKKVVQVKKISHKNNHTLVA
jgi:hypothetical protein